MRRSTLEQMPTARCTLPLSRSLAFAPAARAGPLPPAALEAWCGVAPPAASSGPSLRGRAEGAARGGPPSLATCEPRACGKAGRRRRRGRGHQAPPGIDRALRLDLLMTPRLAWCTMAHWGGSAWGRVGRQVLLCASCGLPAMLARYTIGGHSQGSSGSPCCIWPGKKLSTAGSGWRRREL